MNHLYPNLFSEFKIGSVSIKNRIVMAPMGTGHASSDHSANNEMVEYYSERARGGVGMVIVEGMLVSTEVDPFPLLFSVPRIDKLSKVAKIAEIADAIKSYGSVACLQLSIGVGIQADSPAQAQPVAPSPLPAFSDPSIMCRELTKEDINKIIEATAQAAEYAMIAGFQIIEVHAHTGYLLDQFLSTDTNKRTDEYGGSTENRFRLAKELLDAIRKKVGSSIPVTIRLTIDHKTEGFRTIEEGIDLCKLAEQVGYDAVHVDAGRYNNIYWIFPPAYLGESCMSDISKKIKENVSIPVIGVGNYGVPANGERAIADGCADFIALGRELLADPDWAIKAQTKHSERIRPCIQCNERCIGRLFQGKEITCSVNPRCGRESRLNPSQAEYKKRVVVIGGGPAGVETAVMAARRGHNVILLEKSGQLGGQLNIADCEKFKYSIRNYNNYLKHRLLDTSVEVRLNTEATPDKVKELAPDAVVVAAGASVFIPPIEGFDNPKVMTVEGLQKMALHGNEKVIVVGGGMIGCETALSLANAGHEVTLIEMMDGIARDLFMINKMSLMEEISKANIRIHTNTKCEGLREGLLICTDQQGNRLSFASDLVITATGTRPSRIPIDEYQSFCDEIYEIGDCCHSGKIGDAVHAGFYTGMKL